jgi:hypothetical protein
MGYCCRAFEYWHGMAGMRGFGAFAAQIGSTPASFIIQHRALDSDASAPAFSSSPLSLVSDLVVQFCPWCGVKLDEFYRGQEQKIERTDLKLL